MTNKIFLFGASGKMGTMVQDLVTTDSRFHYCQKEGQADVFLDFSAPTALDQNISIALSQKKPLIIGTTGHTQGARKKMEEAARQIPVFYASNFSLGVTLSAQVLQTIAKHLPDNAKISMTETHHLSKKDAPSGTAQYLAKALNLPNDLIESKRVDKVTFLHEVQITFGSEKITLQHEAFSREVFANGALLACHFLFNKPSGLYSMEDLLEKN